MKRSFLLFSVVVLANTCFAQNDVAAPSQCQKPETRYELGFNLFNMQLQSESNSISGTQNYPLSYFTGIYFKHHCHGGASRISYDRYQKGVSSYYEVDLSGTKYSWSAAGTSISNEFKIGLQYSFCKHKFQPYVLADFVFRHTKTTGDYSEGTSFYEEGIKYGIAPGIGFSYKISKNISLIYEGTALFNRYSRQNLALPAEQRYWSQIQNFGLDYNPVRALGLSILF
jgi:hypothetical protein